MADSKINKDGVIHLFNGKDLSNFYTFIKDRGRNNDPKKVFTVKDGMIRISGEEYGCITTLQEFENYHLIVEFKWGKMTFAPRKQRARDSGILLHSVGEDGAWGGIWMNSIEMQMIEGGTGDLLVLGDDVEQFRLTCTVAPEKSGDSYVYQPDGKSVTIYKGRINWWGRDPDWKDVKGFRGKNDAENPLGKWNRYEGIVKGQGIKAFLNGLLINECTDIRPHKGRIQFQSEGAEVFFRRIDLIP
ncbi:unnamed protein product, partial [marine sediment metagenome]